MSKVQSRIGISAEVEEGPGDRGDGEALDFGDMPGRQPSSLDEAAQRQAVVAAPWYDHLDLLTGAVPPAPVQASRRPQAEHGAWAGQCESSATAAPEIEWMVSHAIDAVTHLYHDTAASQARHGLVRDSRS
jgi:hypothetical protein